MNYFVNCKERINFAVVKLSIIIPVYCVEKTLERCVKSVVSQTYEDMEIILVDDGSPDSCPQLCDAWLQRDNRIRVIHKQNGGLSDARNAGLDVATGNYVTFVDSDDYLATDTYAQVMKLVDKTDIVEFPLWRFYGSKSQQLVTFKDEYYENIRDYWLKGHAYEHCYAWNKIYRSSLFNNVRFPKGQVFEDVSTLPMLLTNVKCVRTCDQGLYYYCANKEGITATATGKELQMLLEAHLHVLKQWFDNRYYMHVLNIQLDVCRMTGLQPELKRRCVWPFAKGLTISQRLKAIVINTLGIKTLCHINKRIRRS